MRILSIGVDLSGNNVSFTELSSSLSFFDYEMVLYDPLKYIDKINFDKQRLNAAENKSLLAHLERRNFELAEYIKSGGTVIYFPHADYEYDYVDHRGMYVQGKIRDHIFQGEKVEKLVGTKFELIANADNAAKDFFSNTLELYYYRVNFKQLDQFKACLKIPKTDKVVGGYWQTNLSGRIFLSPVPKLNTNKNILSYLSALNKLYEDLHVPPKTDFQLPDWHNQYLLPEECEAIEAVHKAEEEIARSAMSFQNAKENKEKIEELKNLITATGDDLEKIVHKILNRLGLPVVFGEPGRADLIGNFDTKPVVIEIKVKTNKGAAEADAAQLEKWASSYHAENEIQPKAILIVNGYAALPLNQRNEPVFPNQMLKYCESRGHSLISGLQLLCMYLETHKNPDKQESFIRELIENVGIYPKFANNEWAEIIEEKL